MRNRIPPLTSLRAFEAAARLNSFTKAADDLLVTPAAVSQQIKQLEEHLGVQLFERTNKGIRITEAGEQYFPMVYAGFEMLRKASLRLKSFRPRDQLVVSVLPSLASQWLGARLFHWCADNPDVQIAIVAADSEPDFEEDEVHLRICYGRPHQRHIISERLMVDSVSPMCSPSLLGEGTVLERPEQILDYPLIHIDWGSENDTLPSWREWFEEAGLADADCARGPVFNLSSVAIQAAVQGKGFVLGQQIMAAYEIESGRLVKPFDLELPLRESYYLAYPETTAEHPYFETFRAWLHTLAGLPQAEGQAQV